MDLKVCGVILPLGCVFFEHRGENCPFRELGLNYILQ